MLIIYARWNQIYKVEVNRQRKWEAKKNKEQRTTKQQWQNTNKKWYAHCGTSVHQHPAQNGWLPSGFRTKDGQQEVTRCTSKERGRPKYIKGQTRCRYKRSGRWYTEEINQHKTNGQNKTGCKFHNNRKGQRYKKTRQGSRKPRKTPKTQNQPKILTTI